MNSEISHKFKWPYDVLIMPICHVSNCGGYVRAIFKAYMYPFDTGHFCFLCKRSRVRILARRPAILRFIIVLLSHSRRISSYMLPISNSFIITTHNIIVKPIRWCSNIISMWPQKFIQLNETVVLQCLLRASHVCVSRVTVQITVYMCHFTCKSKHMYLRYNYQRLWASVVIKSKRCYNHSHWVYSSCKDHVFVTMIRLPILEGEATEAKILCPLPHCSASHIIKCC